MQLFDAGKVRISALLAVGRVPGTSPLAWAISMGIYLVVALFIKGRVKYRVKAAYVIINFVMNSAGPTRARARLTPTRSMHRATPSVHLDLQCRELFSGTKPRRLQL